MGAKYVAHVKLKVVLAGFCKVSCKQPRNIVSRKAKHESHGDVIGKYPAYLGLWRFRFTGAIVKGIV